VAPQARRPLISDASGHHDRAVVHQRSTSDRQRDCEGSDGGLEEMIRFGDRAATSVVPEWPLRREEDLGMTPDIRITLEGAKDLVQAGLALPRLRIHCGRLAPKGRQKDRGSAAV
jgi:hypothetical protein